MSGVERSRAILLFHLCRRFIRITPNELPSANTLHGLTVHIEQKGPVEGVGEGGGEAAEG